MTATRLPGLGGGETALVRPAPTRATRSGRGQPPTPTAQANVADPGYVLTITVHGVPAPQGSKKIGRGKGGRPIILDDNDATAPWREHVGWAARRAMGAARQRQPLAGPLRVEVTFTVRKPKSAPKTRRTWPAVKPDLDKYQRSTFDALTDVGVYGDDGQIVEVLARKVFPDEGIDALTSPGAVIRIWAVGGTP